MNMNTPSKTLQRFTLPNVVSTVGAREIKVIVATEDVARDGNVLVIAGINLTSFRANPTVLWQHDSKFPIARCTAINVVGKTLQATVNFPPEGTSVQADEALRLIKAGVVNAMSIGWIPLAQEPIKDARGVQTGWKFTRSDMLEFSVVSVPADPNALVIERAVRAGKVLSSANESHVRAIADSAADISRRAQAVLDQARPIGPGSGDDDGRAACDRRRRCALAMKLNMRPNAKLDDLGAIFDQSTTQGRAEYVEAMLDFHKQEALRQLVAENARKAALPPPDNSPAARERRRKYAAEAKRGSDAALRAMGLR